MFLHISDMMASHEVLYCYSSLHISDVMASHEVLYCYSSLHISDVMASHEGTLLLFILTHQ